MLYVAVSSRLKTHFFKIYRHSNAPLFLFYFVNCTVNTYEGDECTLVCEVWREGHMDCSVLICSIEVRSSGRETDGLRPVIL